jgi:hypothetical protein
MIRQCSVLLMGVLLAGAVQAADEPLTLSATHGSIDKAGKTNVVVLPRGAGGKFEKALTLHVTGTSRVTKLGHQVRGGKSVFTQKDGSPRDLKAKQAIAAIYTTGKAGPVLLTGVVPAEGTSLVTVHGAVDKVGKDSVTVQPRSVGGRFEKAVTLLVTGTSRVTRLSHEKRAGKEVFVQKDAEAKDLKAKQSIAAVYATGKGGNVLLTAVVLPASGK